jgi:2-phosphosulfolactate phosphatase
MLTYDQHEFNIRCEWGEQGVEQLAPISDVVVIVDVLSFSTCVEIATSRGAVIYPYRRYDASAAEFAASVGAELADKQRRTNQFSLSPVSLLRVSTGMRLVLPSPNGATLTLASGKIPVLAGCLRNASAVAAAATQYGRNIAVIPAGERWADGSLRPAFEDLVGAGAIINRLTGAFSPEARLAIAAFRTAAGYLSELISHCSSGKELIERGFVEDVDLCATLNVSDCVPVLVNGAYAAKSTAQSATSEADGHRL